MTAAATAFSIALARSDPEEIARRRPMSLHSSCSREPVDGEDLEGPEQLQRVADDVAQQVLRRQALRVGAAALVSDDDVVPR